MCIIAHLSCINRKSWYLYVLYEQKASDSRRNRSASANYGTYKSSSHNRVRTSDVVDWFRDVFMERRRVVRWAVSVREVLVLSIIPSFSSVFVPFHQVRGWGRLECRVLLQTCPIASYEWWNSSVFRPQTRKKHIYTHLHSASR